LFRPGSSSPGRRQAVLAPLPVGLHRAISLPEAGRQTQADKEAPRRRIPALRETPPRRSGANRFPRLHRRAVPGKNTIRWAPEDTEDARARRPQPAVNPQKRKRNV